MNELKIFQNKVFGAVRVVEHNGEPWFVAKDIARALDYAEQSNPARLFRSVPEEWKGVKQIHTPGGEQDMLIISEQDSIRDTDRPRRGPERPDSRHLAASAGPCGQYVRPWRLATLQQDAGQLWPLCGNCGTAGLGTRQSGAGRGRAGRGGAENRPYLIRRSVERQNSRRRKHERTENFSE